MDSGHRRGSDTGGIGIRDNYGDDIGGSAGVDMDPHAEVGGMKSLVFWTVVALVAAVSASWMQKEDPVVSSPVEIAQQVVQPQFPAQARGGGMVPAPSVMTAPAAPPSMPLAVMPRPVPGVAGPPPQAQAVVPQPYPNAPGMMPRRTMMPPPAMTAQQPPGPAGAQTAIPIR